MPGGDWRYALPGAHPRGGAARRADRPDHRIGGQGGRCRDGDIGPVGGPAAGASGPGRGPACPRGGDPGTGRADSGRPAGRADSAGGGAGRRSAGPGRRAPEQPPLPIRCCAAASTTRSPAAGRAEEHRRAASLLADGHAGAGRIAEHLLATAPAGDGWVVEQLEMAAREASVGGAPESAAAYLRRALDEPPPPEASASLQLMLGVAEFSAGRRGWEHHLAGAVTNAGDDAARVIAALLFAQALRLPPPARRGGKGYCDRVAARLGGSDTDAHLMLQAMVVACGKLDASTAPSIASRGRGAGRAGAGPAGPAPRRRGGRLGCSAGRRGGPGGRTGAPGDRRPPASAA